MTGRPDPTRMREILQALPDLLSGPEPLLDSPASLDLLAKDPDLRGALSACAELVDLHARGAREYALWERKAPPAVRKPLDLVRRYCATELYVAIHEYGRYRVYSAAVESGAFFSCFRHGAPQSKTLAEIERDTNVTCEALSIPPDLAWSTVPATLRGLDEMRASDTEAARAAFLACSALRRGSERALFWLTLLDDDHRTAAQRARIWTQFTGGHATGVSRAAATTELMSALLELRRYTLALAACAGLDELARTDPMLARNEWLCAVAARDRGRSRRSLHRLLQVCATPSGEEALCAAFRCSPRIEGRDLPERSSVFLMDAERELPASVWQAILGAVR